MMRLFLGTGVHLNIVGHNHNRNVVGRYNDDHMKTMLNDAFRYEENNPVTRITQCFQISPTSYLGGINRISQRGRISLGW